MKKKINSFQNNNFLYSNIVINYSKNKKQHNPSKILNGGNRKFTVVKRVMGDIKVDISINNYTSLLITCQIHHSKLIFTSILLLMLTYTRIMDINFKPEI